MQFGTDNCGLCDIWGSLGYIYFAIICSDWLLTLVLV